MPTNKLWHQQVTADMPLEERQKRAGQELAQDMGEPSVLRQFLVMQAWKVDAVIWPANMGTNLKAPRCE